MKNKNTLRTIIIVLFSIIALLISAIFGLIIYSVVQNKNPASSETSESSENTDLREANDDLDLHDEETLNELNKTGIEVDDDFYNLPVEGVNQEFAQVTALTGDVTYWFKMQNMIEYGDSSSPEYEDTEETLNKFYKLYADGNYDELKNEFEKIIEDYKITSVENYELSALYTDACEDIQIASESKDAKIAAYKSRMNILTPIYDLTLLDPSFVSQFISDTTSNIPAKGEFTDVQIDSSNGTYYHEVPYEMKTNYVSKITFKDANGDPYEAYVATYGNERTLVKCHYTGDGERPTVADYAFSVE